MRRAALSSLLLLLLAQPGCGEERTKGESCDQGDQCASRVCVVMTAPQRECRYCAGEACHPETAPCASAEDECIWNLDEARPSEFHCAPKQPSAESCRALGAPPP